MYVERRLHRTLCVWSGVWPPEESCIVVELVPHGRELLINSSLYSCLQEEARVSNDPGENMAVRAIHILLVISQPLSLLTNGAGITGSLVVNASGYRRCGFRSLVHQPIWSLASGELLIEVCGLSQTSWTLATFVETVHFLPTLED